MDQRKRTALVSLYYLDQHLANDYCYILRIHHYRDQMYHVTCWDGHLVSFYETKHQQTISYKHRRVHRISTLITYSSAQKTFSKKLYTISRDQHTKTHLQSARTPHTPTYHHLLYSRHLSNRLPRLYHTAQ